MRYPKYARIKADRPSHFGKMRERTFVGNHRNIQHDYEKRELFVFIAIDIDTTYTNI